MSKLDQLGEYEKQAVRTVERQGFSVAERAPESPGCWVVWHYDQSYPQSAVKVFGTEVEALRWALDEAAGHKVTFVPWGQSPEEAMPEHDAICLANDGGRHCDCQGPVRPGRLPVGPNSQAVRSAEPGQVPLCSCGKPYLEDTGAAGVCECCSGCTAGQEVTDEQGVHDYVSTACQHRLHDRCRESCKFCLTQCGCLCHPWNVTR